jgi:sarcosine oxidase subunit gamma
VSDFDAIASGGTAPGEYGATPSSVTLAEALIGSAWNVQGDPRQASFVARAKDVSGVALPLEPNTTAHGDHVSAFWLGPRSWLLVAGRDGALADFALKRNLLNQAGAALFDVSAGRIAWTVSGAAAARVLQKTCPLDLHPRHFAVGQCAQSVLGHINGLFYKMDSVPTFIVMVARSFAADAWTTLCASAATEGYRVAPPAAFPEFKK